MKKRGLTTELIYNGEQVQWHIDSPNVPICETTTFVFDSADQVRQDQEGRVSRYLYSRYENPTVVVTEGKLAALDGAEAALVFSSGMAAISSVLFALLSAGDELVTSAALYGGTFHLVHDVLSRFGVGVRTATLDELASPARVIGPRTKLVWFESPINPTLRCVDVHRIAEACRERGVVSAMDNTFASPVNQRPIALGVDLAMQSATKYLNGHTDVTAGCVAGTAAMIEPVKKMRRQLGGVLDPQPAYLLGRSLKTLPLRIARHNATALAVARFLEADHRVRRVFYPGLASHPDHEVAAAQMQGFGGMVCVEVDGGLEGASRLFDRLKLIRRATSLGGVESLASLPVLTSHYNYSDEELARAGVTPGMLRLSVGLEETEDLVSDLDQALG